MMRRSWLVVVALALGACEPAADVEPLACANPQAGLGEVGEGNLATGFLDLPDGSDIQVVLGPQGLHMVVVALRVDAFELPTTAGGKTRVTGAVRQLGRVIGGTVDRMTPSTIDDAMVEFAGIRLIFRDELETFIGQVADIAVTATDDCGREISATRRVLLVQ